MTDKEIANMILSQHLMMDEIAALLVRGGLSPRTHVSNTLSVYLITETNEFDGIFEPQIRLLGRVHFQGDEIMLQRESIHDPWTFLDLSDPNSHITLLKFFGVEHHVFQIFADCNKLDDINLAALHGNVNANHPKASVSDPAGSGTPAKET